MKHFPFEKTMYLPNGKKVTLYPISILAECLGRTPHTIRKWEIAGVLPKTMFNDAFGNRLYSREQIMIIYQCAEEAMIGREGKPISKTPFSRLVRERLALLGKKYTRKRGTKVAEEAKFKNERLNSHESSKQT